MASESAANQQPISSKSAVKIPRSRKNPAIKTQVIAKYAQGQDKTRIARDLGITRNTVRAIVKETDLDLHISTGQQLSTELIPSAIKVMHDRLKKGSENAAIHVLENTIWPLNSKTSKPMDTGLTLAIQNLMGNVQVNTTTNSALLDNSKPIIAESSQVVDNKEQPAHCTLSDASVLLVP